MSTSSANKRPHPKLDAEFLAKQLPQFQEKLATAQKVRNKEDSRLCGGFAMLFSF